MRGRRQVKPSPILTFQLDRLCRERTEQPKILCSVRCYGLFHFLIVRMKKGTKRSSHFCARNLRGRTIQAVEGIRPSSRAHSTPCCLNGVGFRGHCVVLDWAWHPVMRAGARDGHPDTVSATFAMVGKACRGVPPWAPAGTPAATHSLARAGSLETGQAIRSPRNCCRILLLDQNLISGSSFDTRQSCDTREFTGHRKSRAGEEASRNFPYSCQLVRS